MVSGPLFSTRIERTEFRRFSLQSAAKLVRVMYGSLVQSLPLRRLPGSLTIEDVKLVAAAFDDSSATVERRVRVGRCRVRSRSTVFESPSGAGSLSRLKPTPGLRGTWNYRTRRWRPDSVFSV